ncbi:MAG TPA: type 4a pilus biogenesis protein PilO [Candidatus Methylomirabilis sp.]|nr:type 4a pilus biogenesis protein PilO [Candidatus Methylomirabilis sp.]
MALDLKGYFANIPKRQTYILLGVLGAGLVAAYAYFLMIPLWEQRERLAGELNRLQTEVAQKRSIAANRVKLEADIKELDKQLAVALVKLPEEKDIPKLLTQINTLGQQNGLEFQLFRPGAPARKGFYAEVPIDIRVEGQYHSLGSFLDRVSKLERIVNVSDIKISPLTAQQQQLSGRSLVADLKATTFTFLEKGGATGAPAKK